MIISVINHSNGKLKDADILPVIRAINRQIAEDYFSYWSIGATLRLEGRSNNRPDTKTLSDMRGDAVIYIWDSKDKDGAEGYHERNDKGIPYGVVYLQISKELKEDWSITLSHEALELVGDPEVNLLVQGPHPDPDIKHDVFYWYEMCDAVQNEWYEIDGVKVSNFVLPLYFTGSDEYAGRNDFLGTINKSGNALLSFGINPGGYVGFFNPKTGKHVTYYAKDDKRAIKRMEIKGKVEATRRAFRYQRQRSHNPKSKVMLVNQKPETKKRAKKN